MPASRSRNSGSLRQIVLRLSIPAWMAVAVLGCMDRPPFLAWGLTGDLPDYMPQLVTLEIPPTVTSLDWLPSHLKELTASGASISSLHIPWELERLHISRMRRPLRISAFPPALRELDMSFTSVPGPSWLPESLESLTLGGPEVRTLKGLNGTLLDLNLVQVSALTSLEGIPPAVQSLSISDALSLKELNGLPPRLKALALSNTQIRALKGLPATLQDLTLENNYHLQEVELPRFLLRLRVAGNGKSDWPIDHLPFLQALEIPFARPGLPPSLRRLSVYGIPPASLPQGLAMLQWPQGTVLRNLPCQLKELDIRGTLLPNLDDLPPCLVAGLVRLDISNTRIALEQLPSGLQSLRFHFYPGSRLTGLRTRLPRLRELDLSGSKALKEINDLPDHLVRLNLRETGVASLPPLPSSLRELDISNTPIKNLAGLNKGLTRVFLHAGQLRSLKGLPDSVRALHFVEEQK